MIGRFGTGWLHFETKRWCPDFSFHTWAGVLTLERVHRCCLSARAGVLTLERVFPSPSTLLCSSSARAVVFTLERDPLFLLLRSSGEFDAQAGTSACKTSGRVQSTLELLSSRSSMILCLTLERGFLRSSVESIISVRDFTFWITFWPTFSFLTFKNRHLRVSLSTLTFSLRFDLFLGVFYPSSFERKVELRESFLLIWKREDLEHFGFWIIISIFSILVVIFKVGISYSIL